MPTLAIRSYDSTNSNWTLMYVVLSLIPVAFAAVAVLSARRDKASQREKHDIEMAMIRQRKWFLRREAVTDSERPGGSQGRDPLRALPRAVMKPPVPPSNFGRPIRVSKVKGLIDMRSRDR